MPWIQQIPIEDADGLLKKEYDKALQRAGRLWHIVHVMSLNPLVLKTSIQFYGALMFGRSPLSRMQRELLATVVSQENHCFYWTQAHAHDLRAEVADQFGSSAEADAFVHLVARNWREAPLSSVNQSLCEYAVKLTHHQNQMGEQDLQTLRLRGFDDAAIHDATQIIAYFNYINRIAEALGVEPETFIDPPWGSVR